MGTVLKRKGTKVKFIQDQRQKVLLLFVFGLLLMVGISACGDSNQSCDAIININSCNDSNGSSGSAPPEEAVIWQYYDDINSKNYQGAHDLWYPQPQSVADFQAGFGGTTHDDLTINSETAQANGNYYITVTLAATYTDNTQRTLNGYYVVGQVNGGWRLVDGSVG